MKFRNPETRGALEGIINAIDHCDKYEDIDEKEDNMDKQDKLLSEWTLGETLEFCHRDDSFCTRGEKECPLFRTVCKERVADWDLQKEMKSRPVDPNREGLGPSPTGETEAPREDVGAGSKPARSKLAEVLGVDEDEIWVCKDIGLMYRVHGEVVEYRVNDGEQWEVCMHSRFIFDIINHPESIVHLPRLTESEIAVMRMIGAKWVSRNEIIGGDCVVNLWKEKPLSKIGLYTSKEGPIATVNDPDIFSSVKPGECIGVEEAER